MYFVYLSTKWWEVSWARFQWWRFLRYVHDKLFVGVVFHVVYMRLSDAILYNDGRRFKVFISSAKIQNPKTCTSFQVSPSFCDLQYSIHYRQKWLFLNHSTKIIFKNHCIAHYIEPSSFQCNIMQIQHMTRSLDSFVHLFTQTYVFHNQPNGSVFVQWQHAGPIKKSSITVKRSIHVHKASMWWCLYLVFQTVVFRHCTCRLHFKFTQINATWFALLCSTVKTISPPSDALSWWGHQGGFTEVSWWEHSSSSRHCRSQSAGWVRFMLGRIWSLMFGEWSIYHIMDRVSQSSK